MPKIKLLHIITTLEVAGAQKVVFDLCRLINRSNFEVTVVAITPHQGMLEMFRENNIPVIILGGDKTIKSAWTCFQKISQLIQEKKMDIVHAHLTHASILAALLKIRFPKIKVLFTPHSFNLGSKLRYLFTRITKPLRSVDILFSKEMHRKSYRTDAVIIPNGIATTEFDLDCPKFEVFTFICIGRLEKVKNQIALIEPVKQLKAAGYKFELFLIGDGKERAAIEAAIAAHQVESHIKLLGLRRDIPQLCNKAQCLIIPSLWEGFPIALLESGASALPVITTNVGSIGTLINSKTGYLLSDIEQLTQEMTAVLTDYQTAQQKGKALQQKIKNHFDIQIIVQKHEQLYTQLINSKYQFQ